MTFAFKDSYEYWSIYAIHAMTTICGLPVVCIMHNKPTENNAFIYNIYIYMFSFALHNIMKLDELSGVSFSAIFFHEFEYVQRIVGNGRTQRIHTMHLSKQAELRMWNEECLLRIFQIEASFNGTWWDSIQVMQAYLDASFWLRCPSWLWHLIYYLIVLRATKWYKRRVIVI